MGLTYDVLKTKVKSEGKFTMDELMWMVDKMKEDGGLKLVNAETAGNSSKQHRFRRGERTSKVVRRHIWFKKQ